MDILSRIKSRQGKDDNVGERVTRKQQWSILLSTSLVAFTVIGKVSPSPVSQLTRSMRSQTVISLTRTGFTQSFGVFQAHYGREKAVREGVLHRNEMTQRALISSIGSLGNGGLVAVFGVFYYPRLPQIGGHVRTLCFVGAACVAMGFGLASISRSVSTSYPLNIRQPLILL